jgi:hypothetical protein
VAAFRRFNHRDEKSHQLNRRDRQAQASSLCASMGLYNRKRLTRLYSGEGKMRTDDFRPSSNVEDDREASASRGGMPGGAGGLGIGTIIIVTLVGWYFGIDPSLILNGLGGQRWHAR